MSGSSKHIVLIGAPNSGKTSIFNQVTGFNCKTVNYPGSTVDISQGPIQGQANIQIIDTPGILNIYCPSEDERITLSSLFKLDTLVQNTDKHPDRIVFVIDSTQRSRHLVLVKPFLEAGYPITLVLSMRDLAKTAGKTMDLSKLSKALKVPVFAVNGRDGTGISELKQHLADAPKQDSLWPKLKLSNAKAVSDDYRWADELIKRCTTAEKAAKKPAINWDRWALHPILGPIIFLLLMSGLFYSIFAASAPLMDAVDGTMAMLSETLGSLVSPPLLQAFVSDALIGSLAGVLVFVPQIAILFFIIGLLEASGYLARATLLVDRFLQGLGLSGRSFVPMLSGVACAVPALMAARNIPSEKERKLCMFLIPLMQCSARLPVYGLLLGLLFHDRPWLSGWGLLAIYLGSIVLTSVVAAIAGRYLNLKASDQCFQMELPPWRAPLWIPLIRQSLRQTRRFITGAGPIIFGLSILLWTVSVFPNEEMPFIMHIGEFIGPIFKPMGVDWRVGVAILFSFAAREVFVSALVLVFALGAQDGSFIAPLQSAVFMDSGAPIFTIPSIVGLIIFFMIAMQCAATLATARREMNGWTLPMIQLLGFIGLAYGLAVIAVQGLQLLGF